MTERNSSREGVLVVEFPGRPLIELQPGAPAFTFGRGSGRTLRFAHDTAGGLPDLEVSRHAGTVWWENGLWWVRNDSATRPFDIVTAQGVRIPLLPRSWSDSFLVWVPSPRLEIRIEGPYGPYVLTLTVNYDIRPRPLPEEGDDDESTRRLPRVTARDRLLLAAKFLALPVPGEAVGDQEAADYANAALSEGRPATPKAVEDCVRKWRERFQGRGVTDIDGQRNINNLGRKLLAWGILHPEDRDLLRPRRSR